MSAVRTAEFHRRYLRGHNPRRNIGIDQGNAYSPIALNVSLHDAHDKHMEKCASPSKLLWWRYVDNIVYLAKSMSEGRQVCNKPPNSCERSSTPKRRRW